jgi:hypothetical protein
MGSSIFWDLIQYSLVDIYQNFGATFSLNFRGARIIRVYRRVQLKGRERPGSVLRNGTEASWCPSRNWNRSPLENKATSVTG